MVCLVIMATYARVELIATWSEKLTVSLIVLATKNYSKRISIRRTLTWDISLVIPHRSLAVHLLHYSPLAVIRKTRDFST